MYHLNNDYSELVHPKIMAAMALASEEQHQGYGVDECCERAASLIRSAVGRSDADVHFLVGGTQTNTVMIGAALKPWQAVVSTHLGHINVHETGAIESTGHKVVTVVCKDGKLTPDAVASALASHSTEHMVMPKMVYISNTTEIGTVYTKAEMQALSTYCKANGLYLFVDGARLGCALACEASDLTLADLATYTDCFYIGGTKNGAMCGEALVILNPALKEDIRFYIKQRGGLLAKGWLLGIQFEQLFSDDLFFELGAHANRTAAVLREGLSECGVKFASESFTNQIFPIFSNALIEKLHKTFVFSVQARLPGGENSICRLCTSWATKEEECYKFVSTYKQLRFME